MLLDINMPVMDGLTLLTRVGDRNRCVAIIVSAYGDMTNIRTAMNRGAFDFVTKPIDLNDLEITMRKTLVEIARVRDLDRRRAVAERARANLSRYFSPHFAALLAEHDVIKLGPMPRASSAAMVCFGLEHGASRPRCSCGGIDELATWVQRASFERSQPSGTQSG